MKRPNHSLLHEQHLRKKCDWAPRIKHNSFYEREPRAEDDSHPGKSESSILPYAKEWGFAYESAWDLDKIEKKSEEP